MEKISVSNVRMLEKGPLLLKCDVDLEDRRVKLRDVLFFSNHNGDWVNLPSRPYEKDGKKQFYKLILLTDENSQEILNQIAEEVRNELTSIHSGSAKRNLNVEF